MIAVIQCAGSKRALAGRLRALDGRSVVFVARPDKAVTTEDHYFAHPDGLSFEGQSWRDLLVEYNLQTCKNPLGLLPAWELYRHPIYGKLVGQFGADRTFILSAGWGLLRADFLTPDYDVTFSSAAAQFARRRKRDVFLDFGLPAHLNDEPIVFFGGQSYLPLFQTLTADTRSERQVFYRSSEVPNAPGCTLIRYNTRTRTNWHYECANAFLREMRSLAAAQ